MRKFLSTILASAMLLSSFANFALAAESEDAGQYNSLKLPVINEIRDENTEDIADYGMQTMSLMSVANSGGPSGGGSATTPSSSVLTIKGITEQTASKGDQLVIRNVTDMLSSNDAEEVIYFYENCKEYSAVIEYEKDGNTSLMYYGETVFGNIFINDDAEELIIHVPVELENGTYNVRVHQLNSIWDYREGGYSELVFEFDLTVTDADSTNEHPYSLNEIKALKDTSFSMVEGDFGYRPEFELAEALPGEAKMVGFALCDNGNVFPISGYCDGSVIECHDEFNVLPAGKYDCYFYIASPEFDYANYPNELYGPVKLNISGITFKDEYYRVSSHTVSHNKWTYIEMGKSVAEKIPLDAENEKCTMSMNFKDTNGNIIHSMYDVPVDNLYLQDDWYGNIQGGRIGFYLNLAGFEVGSYCVDITLKDESGNPYELGEAVFNVTDKTIIDGIYILNYNGVLTTATDSFYVCVDTSNIFLDYDKIKINLLDTNGNVVAETVSKEMQDVSTYNGSSLIYKLNVTEALDSNLDYTLEIQSDEDVELISLADDVHIRVTAGARVIRTEVSKANIVKIYTENVAPGEYLITDGYDLSFAEEVYTVVIDEQGIGTFQVETTEDDSTYRYFYLKDVNATDSWSNITSFNVYLGVDKEKDYFNSSPEYIAVNATKINNFYVEVKSEIDETTVQNIEYARVTQNGEVIATMSNLEIDGCSYYDGFKTIYLYGDLIVESGKSFTKGNATFEIKYDDGFVYTNNDLIVTDETTGLYGYFKLDNSAYIYQQIGESWVNEVISSDKASFTIGNTNATSGTVALVCGNEMLEELEISDLEKTVKNEGYYTYNGTFDTVISPDNVYELIFKANGEEQTISNFTYCTDKLAKLSSDLIVLDGEYDIYLYNCFNISNLKTLKFKAVMGDNTYDIPVTEEYSNDNHISFIADFSSVPAGYFTLKAFDGSAEVDFRDNRIGYNFGNTTKPIIKGTGSTWINQNREYGVFGLNLDRVNKADVKIYKNVDFPEGRSVKMQYEKDIELPKPYNKNYITVNNNLLSDLETGSYVFVYVIDGVPVAANNISFVGKEPAYKASVVLNGGIEYTNKDTVELKVTATGYTKMRVALSKDDLETAEYEAITATKTVSLSGKEDGLVTVYVQFANDDKSKTETVEASVTIDTVSPTIENANIPELKLWHNAEVSFVTNELLRNAFLTVEFSPEPDTVKSRNYVFAYAGMENGKYKYKCNLYVDSKYEDIASLKTQIIAYDRAGNEAHTDIADLLIAQPRDISGRLTYNGNAVKYANVYLYDKNGYCVDYAYTNDAGEYTFTNITKDDYTIKVNNRFYAQAELNVAADEFAADITGKDFALTSVYSNESAVTVTVKNYNNEAIAGAYVSVYCWETGINVANTTDENGIVTINVPYKDGGTSYRVYANYNDYSNNEYVVVDAATESVDISFPQKATITGVALRGETPVPNTEVTITGSAYTTYTQTNENGEFTADVYLVNGNKSFVVSVRDNSKYSGSADVVFEEELTANVTLNLKGNIRVKGAIKDNMAQSVDAYSSIYFSGNGLYLTVTPDANGEFETPDVFGAGTYSVYAYGSWPYKTIEDTVEISDEDLSSAIKELNLTAEKRVVESKFTTGENKITATADVIAKGDMVTVNVKFQNDGTETLSDVTAYAKVPAGVEIKKTNGVKNDDGTVSKTASTFKADEVGTLTFTIDTDDYNEKSLIIPAYVKVGNKEYPIGAVTIEIASVTLSAPQVVKTNTAFKVSGEAISGSTVEILNYATKEVLATTDLTSKWYFADISGITEETTLIARVSKDGKIAYSDTATVKVEENPIAVKDVKISWNLGEYGINEYYGYPTFSMWEGYSFDVSVKFENMPADATVKYSFINKKNISTTKNSDDYYKGTIKNWSGYGTKKVIATVTDGDKEYEFIVAEVVILIDPSGYITDSETGEPIVGANVLLEVKSGDEWITWDATPHLQQNPMLTDEEGHYGWMVPEGEYRIIVTADGYETKIVEEYDSRDYGENSKITVLPVRTDVDITLVNARAVELDEASTASVAGGKVKFVFTRPVDPATVTAENFKVLKSDGTAVAGSIVLAENNTVALFKPATAMANGDYKLSVANIKDGSNNVIPAEEIPFEKTTEASALAAPTVAYNTDGTITITFADGKTPVNSEEIVVKNGNTVVNGTLRETANVITFIPDVAFTSGTTYKVVVSDAIRTDANEYLAASFEQNITTSGGSNPSNPGSSSGGGGGGGISVAKPKASVTAGEVEVGTKVELSTTTKDAVIYYTTDGTEPTDKSTVYSEAIVINEDVTIKAIAIKDKTKSSVLTAKYTVKKTATSAPAFADIANYAWATEAIAALSEKGIIKGVSDTEFAPAKDIKRADFMLLLVRMLDLKADVTSNFDDVSADKYYYEGVGIAKALELTTGVGDNKFNPESSITRQDMFVLAYRILQMKEANLIDADESAINTFDDYSKIANYSKEALSSLVKNDLVKGSDNKINPVGNATRAETAVFVYRLYNLLNK